MCAPGSKAHALWRAILVITDEPYEGNLHVRVRGGRRAATPGPYPALDTAMSFSWHVDVTGEARDVHRWSDRVHD